MEAKRFEYSRAANIARDLVFCTVGCAIDFDDQLAFDSYEVDDVSVDLVLSPEFPASEPAGPESPPEPALCVRLRGAELARSLPEAFHPPHPAASQPTSPRWGEV